MAVWLQLNGKRFEKYITGGDVLLCSACGHIADPIIERWEENGTNKIRYVHRTKCPNCFARMRDYAKDEI